MCYINDMYDFIFPKPLIDLAKLFETKGHTLYAVGGMVRNPLLDLPISDMDICSSMPPDELILLCKQHRIAYVEKGIQFGMLELHIGQGAKRIFVEHTTFRSDTYNRTGAHRPNDVRFSTDINIDAHRRDFTVNALYRNILTGELVDPTGGIEDLRKRLLRTTSPDPASILKDDGLRIMRLARFAAELMFDIEDATMKAAIEYSSLLSDISAERIRDELIKILLSDVKYPTVHPKDTKYPWSNKVFHGLTLLHKMGAFAHILPELDICDGVIQNATYHEFDVLGHSLRVCACMPQKLHLRLAGLLHDVGKPVALKIDGKMHFHDVYGTDIVRAALTRLRFSKDIVDAVVRLVSIHMYDISNTAKDSTLRKRFAVLGWEISQELCKMRYADILGAGVSAQRLDVCNRWHSILDAMKDENAPMSYAQLSCTGNDIAAWLNIAPGRQIGEIKHKLLEHCAVHPQDNTAERLRELSLKM